MAGCLSRNKQYHTIMDKKDLRIVFFGTPDFAVESLSRLVDGGYNVVGVVTMPDKPAGRGHHLLQSAVKQYAVARGPSTCMPRCCPNTAVPRPSTGP